MDLDQLLTSIVSERHESDGPDIYMLYHNAPPGDYEVEFPEEKQLPGNKAIIHHGPYFQLAEVFADSLKVKDLEPTIYKYSSNGSVDPEKFSNLMSLLMNFEEDEDETEEGEE